ncbi:hypothetical protein LDENG_00050610, partial [Lucifuga dentata]
GCVLSPLLFSLYTNDCQSHYEGWYVIKFADDSVIVSLLGTSNNSHSPVVAMFSQWCDQSFLNINLLKTKEMSIDFRKNPLPILPAVIK